ncbi:MAG: hypothetical protein J5736_01015, partial [Bacilli bacterium]|nr:hypothetical protein [Bacilli bacterium]
YRRYVVEGTYRYQVSVVDGNLPFETPAQEIEALVEGERHPLLKTYALLILLNIKSRNEVVLRKNNKTFRVVPAELKPPYTAEGYQRLMRDISSYTKNTSLNDVAKSLLEEYVISSYPDEVPAEGQEETLIPALFQIACEYLQSQDGEVLLSQYEEERKKAILLEKKAIQNILDGNPPIHY